MDARLFHEAGCHLAHKYRGYDDPFPHPALRGGGGECFPGCYRLWAGGMVIAQLTHLHISIPASGAPPEEVLEEYFPRDMPSRGLTDPRRISFASGVDSPGWWTAIGSIAGYSDT